MPLASLYSLQWYGPGAGAMTTTATASSSISIKGRGRLNEVVSASGSMPNAKATRLVNAPCTINAAGSMPRALPKARARVAAVIKVNELSQDDVAGALLTSVVEGNLTLKDVLRILLSVAAGKTTITDLGAGNATVVFRDMADTKARVTATMSGSSRTNVTKDAT